MADHHTYENCLLAMLPRDIALELITRMDPVAMPARTLIYGQNTKIHSVYFPYSGMVSLVSDFTDGSQAEVGIIGREGMLGTPQLSGVDTSYPEAMVQMPLTGIRMGLPELRQALDRIPPFRTVLQRYHEAMQAQVMQTAACNGRHLLPQRLARWLCMAHDRSDTDLLPLTQDLLAMMLGVQRPSISVAAATLQRTGLISYIHGQVTVLDRPGLEAASCECYATVQRRYADLLGRPAPARAVA